MAIAPRLEVRQSQPLVMTPQLMQAINLLQLSNLDLVAYVDAEVERNPLLERGESEDAPGSAQDQASDQTRDQGDTGGEGRQEGAEGSSGDGNRGLGERAEGSDWIDTQIEREPGTIADKLDTDFENVYQDDSQPGPSDPGALAGDPWQQGTSRGATSSEGRLQPGELRRRDISLSDHLHEQMALVITDQRSGSLPGT